jgi:hypothetical protein
VALAVLTFCARHAALLEERKRAAEAKKGDDAPLQVLAETLTERHGHHSHWNRVRKRSVRWEAVLGRVMGESRTWFAAERDRRREQNLPGPTPEELVARAEAIFLLHFSCSEEEGSTASDG